jgi:hypothetical protein
VLLDPGAAGQFEDLGLVQRGEAVKSNVSKWLTSSLWYNIAYIIYYVFYLKKSLTE